MRSDGAFGLVEPVACKAVAAIVLATTLALTCASAAFSEPADSEGAVVQGVSEKVVVAAQECYQEQPAIEKSEMVYGMLAADGSLRETYVVNRFVSDAPCNTTDFGAYLLVSNLSTTQPLACENGQVALSIGTEPFFYQGTLENAQLPWNIEIAYTLDGIAIEPEELGGSAGRLGIAVQTRENPLANPAFYESFMLQITFTLDGDLCSDIQADDATVAASGKDQTIAFTVLPGHDGSFKLSAQVKDFEMPAAQIAALPYASVVEMPDTSEMEDGLSDLSDALSQLNAGTRELANGVAQLSSGASSLADGAGEFGDGLSQLASSSSRITNASTQIDSVLAQMADAINGTELSGLKDLTEYGPAFRQIAQSLESLRDTMQGLGEAYASMAAMMDSLAGVVNENTLSDGEIAALQAAVAGDEEASAALGKLLTSYYALRSAVSGYYANAGSLGNIEEQLGALANGGDFDQTIYLLYTIADSLDNADFSQLDQLAAGLSSLSSGYSEFHAGLITYTQGVQALNDNYRGLSSGMSQLADGTSELSEGAQELSGGVSQLNRETRNLPAQMRDRMGELMEDYDFPQFDPVSFVDERNKNVTAVQFVMLTDAIEKPEAEAIKPEPEPEPTMWERFLRLFGF